MKVLALVILALGSASARGSGPYLPSGWRPEGPAFYLPAEEKPADNPLKDVILQGSEASGSEALREYGPPKVVEVSQNLVNQGLPDIVTEQTFIIQQDVAVVEANVNAEAIITSAAEEAVTETQDSQTTTLEAEVPILIIEPTESDATVTIIELEVTTENTQASTSSNTEDSDSSANSILSVRQEFVNSDAESPVTDSNSFVVKIETSEQEVQKLEQVVEQEVLKLEQVAVEVQQVEEDVEKAAQSAQNIPDALAYLENGIKQVEIAQAQVDLAILENSGSLEQAPEGFLEYGPPGFREYGPPKDELTKASSDGLSQTESFESTNETRRRRFSPKFRPAKTH